MRTPEAHHYRGQDPGREPLAVKVVGVVSRPRKHDGEACKVAVVAFQNGERMRVPADWIEHDTGEACEQGQRLALQLRFDTERRDLKYWR